MNNSPLAELEILEEKIEKLKWLIPPILSFKEMPIPSTLGIIKRSAGILGKSFPKGISFENKVRKTWKNNSLKRIT